MIDLINFLLTPLQSLLDLINLGFNYVLDFFYTDIYPFLTKYTAELIKGAVISMIQIKIMALKFSWDVAKDLLVTINVSSVITQAWSHVDSKTLQFLTFFRVPEGINLMFSAYATRFVYRFLGF